MLLADHTVQTVILGAVLLGVVSGVLGCFAVLRQQSLMGDVLSHAALPGICLGFLVAGTRDYGSLMAGAFLAGAAAAGCVTVLARMGRLKMDAALGIVLGVFFAAGIVLLTRIQAGAGSGQAGLSAFLFGQAAAVLRSDLWVMAGVAAVALTLIAAFWKEFKLVTFDPAFARAEGLPVLVLEGALTVMIALAIVVGLQMVGVVLMTAMVIAPAAAARQWVDRLGPMIWLSAAFGTVAGVTGALISAQARGLATGPLIVLVASAITLGSILLAPGRGVVWQGLAARRAARGLHTQQVLVTMFRLAQGHGDPAFRSAEGLVDAYHGAPSARTMDQLRDRGLVRQTTQAPDPARHWELTDAGRTAAREELDRRDA